jgi:ElaB/YqjD/DUF883 family membrane-anchored ribosome-binding protein
MKGKPMAQTNNSEHNSSMRQKTHDSVDKIMDKADDIRAKSTAELAHMKEKLELMRHNVDGYIKENPEKSVLIAAGVGVVVGTLITAIIMRRRH